MAVFSCANTENEKRINKRVEVIADFISGLVKGNEVPVKYLHTQEMIVLGI
jgi:hypothetical protein